MSAGERNQAAGGTMSVRAAATWAIASQYTSFALQFVASVVLARWFINPDELGLFSIAFAAVTLVAFLQDFGVNRYVTGERDLTPEKLQTAYTVSVVFAWAVALLALLSAGPVAAFYGDVRLKPITLVVASSYLLVPLAIVPQATCQRRMDYKSNAMIEIGSAAANVAVTIVLAVLGQGALALAWGAFAQQAARTAISQWRAGGMLPWPLRIEGARPVLRIGGTNSVAAICNSITARAPELVIGRQLDSAAVGLFARAAGLALQLRLLIAGAVTGVFYPAFRQVRDRGEPLGPPYLRVVAAYTGVTWPAMAGLAVLAKPLVELLYGPKWLAAAPLLCWIALAQLCYVSLPLYGDLPVLLDRMRGLIRRNLADTAASVALIVVAAPFGLTWIALSRLAHGLIWIVLYAPFLREMIGFSWRDLAAVYARSALATVAAVLPLLAIYAFWQTPAELSFGALLGGTGLGVLCWLAALRLTGHSAFDEIVALAMPVMRRMRIVPA